jgi:hypothetical protein
MTKYTAEMASVFVVVLRAGHIAGPEKSVVEIAKNNHKPFIVLINQCENLNPQVFNGDGANRLKQNYAKTLNVPENLIYFVSAIADTGLFAGSLNFVRRYIVALIQGLICDSTLCDAVSLRFVPDSVIHEIRDSDDEDVFFEPHSFARAATCLISRAQDLTGKNLLAMVHTLNNPMPQPSSVIGLDIFSTSSPFSFVDQMRQIASALNISLSPFLAFIELYNEESAHLTAVAVTSQSRRNSVSSTNNNDMIFGHAILSNLRDQVNQYCGMKVLNSAIVGTPVLTLGAEVLLGIEVLFRHWQRLFCKSSDIIRNALVKTLSGTSPSEWDLNVSQTIQFLTSAEDFQEADNDWVNVSNVNLSVRLNMMSIPDLSSFSDDILMKESVRYSSSRTLWSALLQEIKIQPFATVSRLNCHLKHEAP